MLFGSRHPHAYRVRGQHACAIARKLGIRRIHVHKMSGILSAYGIALSDIAEEVQAPCAVDLDAANYDDIAGRIMSLEDTATERLVGQGFDEEHRHLTRCVCGVCALSLGSIHHR